MEPPRSKTTITRRGVSVLWLCGVLLLAALQLVDAKITAPHRIGMSPTAFLKQSDRRISSLHRDIATHVALTIRGGAEEDEGDSDSDDDSDSDSDDGYDETLEVDEAEASVDESDDEEDAYTDEDEEEEKDEKLVATVKAKSKKKKKSKSVQEYVEPYFMTPTMMIYTTFVPILIARKIDLFQPRVVRLLRFLFITQMIVQQAFIFYVRVMAKQGNDRTMVHVENPMNALAKSQVAGTELGSNEVVKKVMSSFLSKDTTVMEYDRDQANSMQSGIILTAMITWFMHFKLQQAQPLLVTIISGYFQLFYNPLFQVYILGRNLERPFKAPKSPWLQDVETNEADGNATDTTAAEKEEEIEEEVTVEVEVEDAEEEDSSDDSDSDSDSDEEIE